MEGVVGVIVIEFWVRICGGGGGCGYVCIVFVYIFFFGVYIGVCDIVDKVGIVIVWVRYLFYKYIK